MTLLLWPRGSGITAVALAEPMFRVEPPSYRTPCGLGVAIYKPDSTPTGRPWAIFWAGRRLGSVNSRASAQARLNAVSGDPDKWGIINEHRETSAADA